MKDEAQQQAVPLLLVQYAEWGMLVERDREDNEKLTVSRKLKDWKTESGFGEINFPGTTFESELTGMKVW